MRTKQKKILYNLFYEEFQMPDKMNYIKKIMDSCKTEVQLESTLHWGTKVLWNHYDVMHKRLNKYDFCFLLPISLRMIDMTEELKKELVRYYEELLKKI